MNESKVSPYKFLEKILIAVCRRPMTVKNISEIYGIPIVACQREILNLERLGLVTSHMELGEKGKRSQKIYRAVKDKVNIEKMEGRYIVKINISLSLALDLARYWKVQYS